MNAVTIVDQLGALAQETRVEIVKLLAKAGVKGLPAGEISKRLGVLPATLSFHLAHLTGSGLLQSQNKGRFVIYSINCAALESLMAFMAESFCGAPDLCVNPACRVLKFAGRSRPRNPRLPTLAPALP